MKTNCVITIGRQFGSGGRYVGRMLAEKLGIPFYDKELLSEAAKQSGRGRIPQVREMVDLRTALEEMAARPGAMLFYERSTAPMQEVLDRIEGEASILVGGFDESEVELALSMGIPSLTLGPRILRCETAPMAALSVLMYHTGNMN